MSEQPKTHLIHLENREKSGARIYSPTAARNKGPIAAELSKHLPENAKVLEIGSGTGEHALANVQARPDILWQPSDPDAESRASIADWAREAPMQIAPPLDIDVSAPDWWLSAPLFDVIYSSNMLHIAPTEAVVGLARGAGETLPKGGAIILYGPFLFGADSALSNVEFNTRLKLRNPQWGVRELGFVKDIFAGCGLEFSRKIAMPANNHILIFASS